MTSSIAPKFNTWLMARSGSGQVFNYPLELEPISFSRMMDRASPVLLQAACDSREYTSATIVRRMLLGGDSMPRAYLRLEFSPVLITSVDWSDGDLVKEDYKFICRSVKVQFKPQNNDGWLGPAVSGVWPKKS